MRCAIYCRVSTDRQREAHNIDAQREALVAHAQAKGWSIAAIEEDDGVSGEIHPWDRPAMARVLDLAREKSFDVLLVIAVDRIARDDDNIGFSLVRKELRAYGVTLATPLQVYDFDSPEQRFFQDMEAAFASLEKHKIKSRMILGRKRKILEGGRPQMHPLGYGWSEEERATVVVDEEAKAVQAAFAIAAAGGRGALSVASELKRRGIKSGRVIKGKEGYIVDTTIRRLIRNPMYYSGEWTPHPKWLPGHTVEVIPLVGEDVWRAANRAITRAPTYPKRNINGEFLLRGLTCCADCGRRMRAHTSTTYRGKYTYFYYRCPDSDVDPLNHKRCATHGSIRADQVDALVWDHVARLIREPGALRAEVERMVDEEMVEGQKPDAVLRELARQIRALDEERTRAIRMCTKGMISEDETGVELADIERRRAPILQRRELVQIKKKGFEDQRARLAATEEKLAALREVLDELTFEERRAIVQEMVDEVRIDTKTRNIEIKGILLTAEEEEPAAGGGSGPSRPAGGSGEKRESRPRRRAKRDPSSSYGTRQRVRGWRRCYSEGPNRSDGRLAERAVSVEDEIARDLVVGEGLSELPDHPGRRRVAGDLGGERGRSRCWGSSRPPAEPGCAFAPSSCCVFHGK